MHNKLRVDGIMAVNKLVAHLNDRFVPRFTAQVERRPLLLISRIHLRVSAQQQTDNLVSRENRSSTT